VVKSQQNLRTLGQAASGDYFETSSVEGVKAKLGSSPQMVVSMCAEGYWYQTIRAYFGLTEGVMTRQDSLAQAIFMLAIVKYRFKRPVLGRFPNDYLHAQMQW